MCLIKPCLPLQTSTLNPWTACRWCRPRDASAFESCSRSRLQMAKAAIGSVEELDGALKATYG